MDATDTINLAARCTNAELSKMDDHASSVVIVAHTALKAGRGVRGGEVVANAVRRNMSWSDADACERRSDTEARMRRIGGNSVRCGE